MKKPRRCTARRTSNDSAVTIAAAGGVYVPAISCCRTTGSELWSISSSMSVCFAGRGFCCWHGLTIGMLLRGAELSAGSVLLHRPFAVARLLRLESAQASTLTSSTTTLTCSWAVSKMTSRFFNWVYLRCSLLRQLGKSVAQDWIERCNFSIELKQAVSYDFCARQEDSAPPLA